MHILRVFFFFYVPVPVPAPPKIVEFSFPPDVALGDEVIVTCVVKKGSVGPHHVTWWKDNEPLGTSRADQRVVVSMPSKSSATLHIASLRAEDVANYSCTARNNGGSDRVTVSLVVPGNQVLAFQRRVTT